MSLTLYAQPFASYCWKPLIALYENADRRPSVARVVDEARPFRKFFPQGAPDRD